MNVSIFWAGDGGVLLAVGGAAVPLLADLDAHSVFGHQSRI